MRNLSMSTSSRHAAPRGRARAFTLLEAALATLIIGVGVLAMVEAQQSFLQRNAWSTGGATATYLANELREMTRRMPRHDRFSGGLYFLDPSDPSSLRGWGPEPGEDAPEDLDDLDDFDGAVFGDATRLPEGFTMSRRYPGPINAFGTPIPETRYDGSVETFLPPGATEPVEVAMRGWTQIVTVRKVEPTDITTAVAMAAVASQGGAVVRAVDRFPLRVTVAVLRQADPAADAEVMTSLSWVVMP